MNLLDEKSLTKIVENVKARLWKGFVTFGLVSAEVLAVFIIVRLIKLIIYGFVLLYLRMWHSSFSRNMEFRLLLFLFLGKPVKTRQGEQNEEEQQFKTLSMTEDLQLKSPKTIALPQSASQYQWMK